jgi:hypothetical protein
MNVQDIIALAIVGVAVVYAGRSLWRTLHGDSGCGTCANHEHLSLAGRGDGVSVDDAVPDDRSSQSMALKRKPLVPIDDVGRPR